MTLFPAWPLLRLPGRNAPPTYTHAAPVDLAEKGPSHTWSFPDGLVNVLVDDVLLIDGVGKKVRIERTDTYEYRVSYV